MAAKKTAAEIVTVDLTVTGAINTTVSVPVGTSFRAALTTAGHKSSQFTFADEAGKPVSIDRKLFKNLKAVATSTVPAQAAAATAKIQETVTAPKTGRTSGATASTANTPKEAKPQTFKVEVSGSITGQFTATAGQTLREVIRTAQPNSDYNRQSFVDGNGRAIGLDRKIEADYKLTASARVNGG